MANNYLKLYNMSLYGIKNAVNQGIIQRFAFALVVPPGLEPGTF